MKKHGSVAVSGRLQQLLFSPKGAIEGLLLEVRGDTVQVTLEPGVLDAGALERGLGKQIAVRAKPDDSPKARKGDHAVFALDELVSVAGRRPARLKAEARSGSLKGVVSRIHYARHGQPNGVILKSGEFVHLRPAGMKQAGLSIGSRVVARGERRLTALGSVLLEATHVNDHALD